MTNNADMMLGEDMGMYSNDPLGFVMYAFKWDADPALQLVELQEPWASRFNCTWGPDVWACELLDEIGRQAKLRDFDGKTAVEPQRHAIASGHGIGKSTISAWLILWIMSTRPFSKGIVTANTSDQLGTKTWAEVGKWHKRCITGHWFDYSGGKGSMKLTSKIHPESWRCDAQTCREENSESFAGLHAADASPFYLFDEGSAVPDVIYNVAEGGLTDGEPFFFVFGNPTRNTGRFSECFGRLRHRWTTRQIDSRTVQITNKKLIKGWIDDYGEDSDFVRIRVRGIFPKAGSTQFIPRDLVDAAMHRKPEETRYQGRVAVVGVDVARFGDDQSVIRTRIGRDASSFAPKRFREMDTMKLASHVSAHVNSLRNLGLRVTTFIDGGGVGGGVVDRLRQLNVDVIEVQFGSKADDQKKYANKRAEMWGQMKAWLATGSIELDEVLATDLTAVEYGFRPDDSILLESKESMKKRGLASPDDGDALALTFAHHVDEFVEVASYGEGGKHHRGMVDYDPLDLLDAIQSGRSRDYNPFDHSGHPLFIR